MTQDRFQAEVMEDFDDLWEEHQADVEPHKRRDYAETMAEQADMYRDQKKEEGWK